MHFNIYIITFIFSSTFTVSNIVSNYYLGINNGKISGFYTAPSIYPLPEEPDRQPRRRIRGGI